MDSMDQMKSCPQCGAQVLGTAKFCGECGFQFSVEETAQLSVTANQIAGIKIPAPPVIESFAAPQVQPVNESPAAAPQVQPVNESPAAAPQVQPVDESLTAPQIQPVNESPAVPPLTQTVGGIPAAPMQGQSAGGSYGSTATPPVYPPYSPVQPQQKKGKGGLIALFSVLGVLVLAGTILIAGILAGWFKKKEIVLSETKVTVLMEDDVTIKVENYTDIGKPELTAAV